jgi:hypothetical protein
VREAGDESGGYRVAGVQHDDGDRAGRGLGGLGRGRGRCDDDVRVETGQLDCQVGEPAQLPLGVAPLDGNILPLKPTEPVQCLLESLHPGVVRGGRGVAGQERPDPGCLRRRLRVGGEGEADGEGGEEQGETARQGLCGENTNGPADHFHDHRGR